ncbi:MAG: hypothetical protein AAFR23_06235, partial [Pseudomonadota bacterium]
MRKPISTSDQELAEPAAESTSRTDGSTLAERGAIAAKRATFGGKSTAQPSDVGIDDMTDPRTEAPRKPDNRNDHATPDQDRPTRRQPGSAETMPRRPKSTLGWIGLQTARAILPLLILAGAFAGHQYLKATKPAPAKRAPAETSFAVKTVAATRADVRPKLALFGNAVAGREVQL